jgi:hypothetical protein
MVFAEFNHGSDPGNMNSAVLFRFGFICVCHGLAGSSPYHYCKKMAVIRSVSMMIGVVVVNRLNNEHGQLTTA